MEEAGDILRQVGIFCATDMSLLCCTSTSNGMLRQQHPSLGLSSCCPSSMTWITFDISTAVCQLLSAQCARVAARDQ